MAPQDAEVERQRDAARRVLAEAVAALDAKATFDPWSEQAARSPRVEGRVHAPAAGLGAPWEELEGVSKDTSIMGILHARPDM